MKNAARILMIALTMLPLLATAQVGNESKLITHVPFEFMAGNKVIPAGECSVASAGVGSSQILIRNWSAKISQFSMVLSSDYQKGPATNALIFHRYGDRYFLSGMKLASTGQTYSLPAGKAEAELRARNVPASEEILLAAVK